MGIMQAVRVGYKEEKRKRTGRNKNRRYARGFGLHEEVGTRKTTTLKTTWNLSRALYATVVARPTAWWRGDTRRTVVKSKGAMRRWQDAGPHFFAVFIGTEEDSPASPAKEQGTKGRLPRLARPSDGGWGDHH